MTVTFENDSDVIVYAFEKLISFARDNQYLFVANCVWWIAGVTGLDSGLTIFIENLESRREAYQPRGISSTPRDIARGVSPEDESNNYIPDPLRGTRKGKINPIPKMKRQLKKARQAENRKKVRQAKNRQATDIETLS
jgi:hypothetical protein